MACRYLATRRREGPVAAVTLLCTCGVLVGVMALVLALALMDGLQGNVRERLVASNAHVVVRSGWAGRRYDAEAAADVSNRAMAIPGVTATAPFTTTWGLLRSDLVPDGVPVQIKGVDPEAEDRVTGLASMATPLGWKRLLEDGARAVPAPVEDDEDGPLGDDDMKAPVPPAILLGEGLAKQLGVVPGDLVRLLSTRVELSALGPVGRSRAFMVAGLVKTGLFGYDESWAVADYRRMPGADGSVDGIQLTLAEPLKAPELASELRHELGDDHDVTEWTTTFGHLFSAFRWEKLLMVIAVGLIGLVAGFNIFTILTLNVTARVADIGILSALGADSSCITRIFLWMGLLLGGAGTAVGLALGATLAEVLDAFKLVRLDPSVYFVDSVPFRADFSDLAFIGLGMLAVSFLATIVPARAAAALDPVVALRNA